MLQDKSLSKIISWSESGTTVMIWSEEALGKILPNYGFKTNNFAAIQRQLNYYGFRKASNSRNPTEYAHEYFYIGSKSLKDIKKRTSKKQVNVPEPVEVRKETPIPSSVRLTQLVDLTSEDSLVNENRLLKEELIRLRTQNEAHQKTIKDISIQLEMNKKETESLKSIVNNLTLQLESQKNINLDPTLIQEQSFENVISFDIPEEILQSHQIVQEPSNPIQVQEQVQEQVSIPVDIPDELLETHGQFQEQVETQSGNPSDLFLPLDPEMEALMNEILNQDSTFTFELNDMNYTI